MTKPRWQHLDRRKPPAGENPGPTARPAASPGVSPAPEAAAPGPAHFPHAAELETLLSQARVYYRLRQYQQCADVLGAGIAVSGFRRTLEGPPGMQRLLGLSLGRLGDATESMRALRLAVEEEPADETLRASLHAAQIEAGGEPEDPLGENGAAGEVGAAALWFRGQGRLRDRRALEAARLFLSAGERFRRVSPAETLEERLSACYVGQTVAYLVAGQMEAAQQGLSRPPFRNALSAAAMRFGQRMYEVAEAVRALDAAERAPVLGPLAELVLGARLRVRYFADDPSPQFAWIGWEDNRGLWS